jgi:ABC-type dipeptide/oligopeptide/nickel transport system permease component
LTRARFALPLAAVQGAAVLLALYLSIFLAFQVVSLDPVRAVLGPLASADAAQAYRAQLGLDASLPDQLRTFARRLVQGDFGQSIYYRVEASGLVLSVAHYSLIRAAMGALLGGIVGVLLAALSPRRARRGLESMLLLAQSVPALCWLIIGLWGLSRLGGFSPMSHPLVFEALAVGVAMLVPLGVIGTVAVDRIQFVSGEPPYALFMRSLGAPRRSIVFEVIRHHAALFMVLAVSAFPAALTASAFAELLFDLPGLGAQFVRACERGDIPLIHAGATVIALTYVALQTTNRLLGVKYDARQA